MKSKIRLRLLLYFLVSFLVFSVVIGLIFSALFSWRNAESHKDELETRAVSIAQTMTGYFEITTTNGTTSDGTAPEGTATNGAATEGTAGSAAQRQGQGAGSGQGTNGSTTTGSGQGAVNGSGSSSQIYGSYLRLLDAASLGDVWIVDRSLNQITQGRGQVSITYQDLPTGAEDVIARALAGEKVISESFGDFLGSPTITAAAPIVLQDGEVAGVVLLHEQIDVSSSATNSGLIILLFSMAAGVAVSLVVAHLFAGRFTKPLRQMKSVAFQVSEGVYETRTGIEQDDEIGELASALDAMTAKLQQASQEQAKLEKLRRDFVANVSHELRTPVTVIKGSLEALSDGVVTEPAKVAQYHQQMLSESRHLERLVSDLLDLSRLQNPDFDIQMEKVSLNAILEDVIRSIRQIGEGRNINVFTSLNQQAVSLQGDYGRLRQLFLVLLDNALKFSPDGSQIDVEMTMKADSAIVTISDKGCGIGADELPYVFERFYKQRSEENKEGSGLGLAIAKEIAQRHGMSIVLENIQPVGTKATVTIPLVQSL